MPKSRKPVKKSKSRKHVGYTIKKNRVVKVYCKKSRKTGKFPKSCPKKLRVFSNNKSASRSRLYKRKSTVNKALKSKKRYRKSRKSRKISRKSRKFRFNYNDQLTLRDVLSLLNVPNEYCGTVENGVFVVKGVGPPPGTGQRSQCKTDVNYPIRWHTHPRTSKFYPSIEDIFNTVKHSTHTDLIFTQFFCWKINCEQKTKIDDRLLNFVENMNNYLYNKSPDNELLPGKQKARAIPEMSVIDNYVNKLNNAFYRSGYNWNISYILYNVDNLEQILLDQN